MLSSLDFAFVRKLVLDGAAIALDTNQEYLVRTRLEPVARAAGLPDLGALVDQLRRNPNDSLRSRVIEAMTTNETSFFRDAHPFDTLRTVVLPELIAARRRSKTLNIWSAACSCGQEPYSLAMLLLDSFPELFDWKITVLGTDLSRAVLDKARSGIYSTLEVGRGLPARSLARHFDRVEAGFQAKPALRAMMQFRELNLAGRWPALPTFDLVLIRNVLIYFKPETIEGVLANVHKVLAPDGYLMLGTTENLLGLNACFEATSLGRTTVYRRGRKAGK